MAKSQTRYYCQQCGAHSSQWIGKCPSCGAWNSYVEERIEKKDSAARKKTSPGVEDKPVRISEIQFNHEKRILLEDKELNRVLGEGLVPGGITLVGGEPGVGKSTLLLQVAINSTKKRFLYVSGEESAQQIKLRAERIGNKNHEVYIYTETSLDAIIDQIKETRPQIVVIDSIQTVHSVNIESSPGSISQIRDCASEIQQYAKHLNIPVFLIGHITKEGQLAGPKVLEHMVDTVLQFEGDRNYGYRILRSVKNRFGSTSELGIYEMKTSGLREVANPSEILLSHRDENLSGIAIAATMEGMRPILIETQALVSTAAYGTPQRTTTGFDTRRLNMLLAVLEKRNGFRLGIKDVFLNIAGGLSVSDPAIDLAVVASVLSSNEDNAIDKFTCFAAEVGLSGEIRSVNRIEQRIKEADKLGFQRIFISKYNYQSLNPGGYSIEILPLSTIGELFGKLF